MYDFIILNSTPVSRTRVFPDCCSQCTDKIQSPLYISDGEWGRAVLLFFFYRNDLILISRFITEYQKVRFTLSLQYDQCTIHWNIFYSFCDNLSHILVTFWKWVSSNGESYFHFTVSKKFRLSHKIMKIS